MSEAPSHSTISLSDFKTAIEKFVAEIEKGKAFTIEDYLEIGYLWNTILHCQELLSTPTGTTFYELVRDVVMPKMVAALEMVVGRGYSFSSPKYDFRLGGLMEPRFRYRIEELESQPETKK